MKRASVSAQRKSMAASFNGNGTVKKNARKSPAGTNKIIEKYLLQINKLEEQVASLKAHIPIDQYATTDALTGVATRKKFFSELARELKRISRTEENTSILLIEIDYFQKITAAYGQDITDRLLIEVVKIINSCLRETDIPARIGGDEFAVLLPHTELHGAYWVAERIRDAVMKTGMHLGTDRDPVNCSVSIGISTANAADEKDPSDMFKEADTRLYIAKHTGHNQVSVDEIRKTH